MKYKGNNTSSHAWCPCWSEGRYKDPQGWTDWENSALTKCLSTPWSCHHRVSNTLFSP